MWSAGGRSGGVEAIQCLIHQTPTTTTLTPTSPPTPYIETQTKEKARTLKRERRPTGMCTR